MNGCMMMVVMIMMMMMIVVMMMMMIRIFQIRVIRSLCHYHPYQYHHRDYHHRHHLSTVEKKDATNRRLTVEEAMTKARVRECSKCKTR